MAIRSKTSADVFIRLAVVEEVEAIATVLREAFIEYESLYTPEGFAATTPTSDQIRERWNEGPVWVAVQNEEIVGTVAAVSKGSGLYVRSMAVLPGAQGRGIARKLLDEIEHFAIHHHYDHLILNTTLFLKEAIHLYEQYGFQRLDEGKPDAFGRVLFTMVKPLNRRISLEVISIRTHPKPGDLGYVIYLHGKRYGQEYGYGFQFERYVANGLCEFYEKYDPARNRVWVCEHNDRMIGFLLLMDRGESAQLRYFLIEPEYRGIGLGSKLMNLYMDFLRERGYQRSYLWTTHELITAANLYKRFGFQLTEEKESMSFGKPLKEQRYDLILSRG
ncbi:MAG TPA: GNAT family N-acetyltransferase [Anaerolineales bacterium]|nr:GNAT family N-acetyltransferase [Anaerolineales bacterium]